MALDPFNDGKLIEIIYVDRADRDQDDPYGQSEWNGQQWTTAVRVDTAQTTHTTLRGRSTDQWYRRYPPSMGHRGCPLWRSTAGGSLAPDFIARALDYALPVH